uniref:Uncharacterized protein n=1 Tax=Cannabis sativa TaxID=3483 RepID=A0A803Q6T1_CANSA
MSDPMVRPSDLGVNKKLIEKQDPIFGVNSMSTLNRDLFLLENPIPWFVLDCLFQKTRTTSGVKLSLIKLGTSYLGNLISREAGKYQEVEDHKWENKHILDLLRNSLILPSIIAFFAFFFFLRFHERKRDQSDGRTMGPIGRTPSDPWSHHLTEDFFSCDFERGRLSKSAFWAIRESGLAWVGAVVGAGSPWVVSSFGWCDLASRVGSYGWEVFFDRENRKKERVENNERGTLGYREK